MSFKTTVRAGVAMVATTVALTACTVAPYQRGPEPTAAALEASTGPYAVTQTVIADSATPGFGGATISYPTTTADGTFGAVAVSPGFVSPQSAIAWYGPRMASYGFVVITFDTLGPFDDPVARGDQLLAALDYLKSDASPVKSRIDPNRMAVMGHSMGGGGTLEAAKKRPSLRAAIPLTGWSLTKAYTSNTTPTLVIGADNDSIAPSNVHSGPFYDGLSSAREKAYVLLNNATHGTPNSPNATIQRLSVAWLKRFVDDDTRYDQFLCPGPSAGTALDSYVATCPF